LIEHTIISEKATDAKARLYPPERCGNQTMPPKFLEHALILTHDPIATRDWWRDALGLVEGDAPDFGFPVHWLYIGD
jgi:hypothetical protein